MNNELKQKREKFLSNVKKIDKQSSLIDENKISLKQAKIWLGELIKCLKEGAKEATLILNVHSKIASERIIQKLINHAKSAKDNSETIEDMNKNLKPLIKKLEDTSKRRFLTLSPEVLNDKNIKTFFKALAKKIKNEIGLRLLNKKNEVIKYNKNKATEISNTVSDFTDIKKENIKSYLNDFIKAVNVKGSSFPLKSENKLEEIENLKHLSGEVKKNLKSWEENLELCKKELSEEEACEVLFNLTHELKNISKKEFSDSCKLLISDLKALKKRLENSLAKMKLENKK